MSWLNWIFCLFTGHEDFPEEWKTLYTPDGGWQDIVYSWKCARCDRIKEDIGRDI